MTTVDHSAAGGLDTALPTPAAADAWRALPKPRLAKRYRYTGRMPAWAWLAVFGLCIAAALPVIRTSSVTESGMEPRVLEAERERLHSEIRSLAAHVGTLGSLSRVKQQATERLGMIAAPPTIVLTVDEPPPSRTLPARFLPPAEQAAGGEPAAAAEASLLRWLADLVVFE